MTDMDPKLAEAITAFASKLEHLDPELGKILKETKLQSGNEASIMAALAQLMQERPDLGEKIEELADQEFASLRDANSKAIVEKRNALKKLPDRQRQLGELGLSEEDLLFQPEGNAFPQLHPLVQAAIAERLQFDDDIPELRTGTLPGDVMPAVPVEGALRNPIALGVQLETASKEVREELNEEQQNRMAAIESIERGGTNLPILDAKKEIVRLTETPVGVKGYEAGHSPALRKGAPPSALEIAQMSAEIKRKYAFKALTSTQGRKSAVPVIAAMVQKELVQSGCQVSIDVDRNFRIEPIAREEWTQSIETEHEIQPNFSFMDVAAKTLAMLLLRKLDGDTGPFLLRVLPVNTIENRRVGWRAEVAVAQ